MDKRILVAYATFAGSTEEVAVEIGKTLETRGFAVDVVPVLEELPVDDYPFVIVGSAVYGSEWRSEAVEFVEANQAALNRVPVAFFSVCFAGLTNDEATLAAHTATISEPLCPLVEPVDEALFAGRVNRRGVSLFLPDWLARFFPTLDFRKWDKIRAWAATVFASEESSLWES